MHESAILLRQIEQNPRLSEKVESQLFDAIQKSLFLYGEYLPSENELTKLFGVSRSVIREALLKLSARGIIDIQKGKGAQVLKPSLDHVLDPFSRFVNFRCGDEGWLYILRVRQILEPPMVGLAAQYRSDQDLELCSKSILDIKQYSNSKINMIDSDIIFHQTLARASQNPVIPIVLRPLFDVIAKFHSPVFNDEADIERTVKAHEKILDAVAKKNVPAAIAATGFHLKEAEEIISSKLRERKS
jgi:GntR family transcriptional regulator, transcriptional repressor for pyruvate dehydrogenase complex